MPLFGKSKNGDTGAQDDGSQYSSRAEDGEHAPPDERTRLLPHREDSSRVLLTPDDPAVTPYNLWSIRVLRYVTLVFAFATFVWWVLLLVSAFATPPGFHEPGSGFYAFSYASMTLANMLLVLLFFGVPSQSMRALSFAISVSRLAAVEFVDG